MTLLSRSMTRLRCWSTRGVSCCYSPAVSAPWARRGKSASRWASVSRWLRRESSVSGLPSSACSTSRNICGVWGLTGMSTLPWRSLFFLRLVSHYSLVLLSNLISNHVWKLYVSDRFFYSKFVLKKR